MVNEMVDKIRGLMNVRNDLLAGLVVALALIPEAIAFSSIAGLDPKVGLYASFCMATVIAFAGGRPGMISAATGGFEQKKSRKNRFLTLGACTSRRKRSYTMICKITQDLHSGKRIFPKSQEKMNKDFQFSNRGENICV